MFRYQTELMRITIPAVLAGNFHPRNMAFKITPITDNVQKSENPTNCAFNKKNCLPSPLPYPPPTSL